MKQEARIEAGIQGIWQRLWKWFIAVRETRSQQQLYRLRNVFEQRNRREKMQPCVYILASKRNGTLYVGVTSNLIKRVWQHKNNKVEGFSKKYHVHLLVWYEQHETMEQAIRREKTIKSWKRDWKIKRIEDKNPQWNDLYPSII